MPERQASRLGRQGEDAVCGWYEDRGFSILVRNWRVAAGEIDIIAIRGGLVAFCEVKTRSSEAFGTPGEAITPAKARRLRRLAGQWLATHRRAPLEGRSYDEVRIDVACVRRGRDGRLRIEMIEGAL